MDDRAILFLQHLKTERRASAHTVRSYEDDLGLYSRYLARFRGGGGPGGRGPGPAAAVFRLADGAGLCRQHRGAAAGESAFVFSVSAAAGLVASDPSAGLRNPKQPERLPRLLRVDEVIRLLDAVPAETLPGVRDRAMLETLYGGGLRVSELVGLNVDDLDLTRSWSGSAARDGASGSVRSAGMACSGSGAGFPCGNPSTPTKRAVPEPARHPLDDAERRPFAGGTFIAGRAGEHGQSPHLAPQLRHPSAGPRGRPPQRPGTARPPQFDDHADLHPRHTGPDSRYLS